MEGHDEAEGPPPAEVPQEELQLRIGIMFSGTTGAVVASGKDAVTSAPTYGLTKKVVTSIEALEKARPELFNRYAKHRPCGLLDQYGAGGMLIADVHGLPLLPWELAEPIGKAAAKFKKEIAEKQKLAKKKAKRRGADAEAAAAAVLRRRVTIALPSADEVKAAWRRIARAQAPEPPPSPQPAAPEPPAAAVPPPEHVCCDACTADMCPRAHTILDMATSWEAAGLITAAYAVASLARHGRDAHFNRKLEHAQVDYRHALRRLKEAYPGDHCGWSQNSARQVMEWTVRLEAAGQSIPAAVAAARRVGFPLQQAAAALAAEWQTPETLV